MLELLHVLDRVHLPLSIIGVDAGQIPLGAVFAGLYTRALDLPFATQLASRRNKDQPKGRSKKDDKKREDLVLCAYALVVLAASTG